MKTMILGAMFFAATMSSIAGAKSISGIPSACRDSAKYDQLSCEEVAQCDQHVTDSYKRLIAHVSQRKIDEAAAEKWLGDAQVASLLTSTRLNCLINQRKE